MTTIYLSSTFEDLKNYREIVYQALRKSGYEAIAMENYVATDSRPLDKCLKDIAERAKIYVGIFAFRYGCIPPEDHIRTCPYTAQRTDWQGLSITELEFRYARMIGRPCLVFVAKAGTDWNTSHIDALTEKDTEHPGHRIDRLRQYLLTEKTASEFSSPHELASLVQAAVALQIQETGKKRAAEEPLPPTITWDIGKDGTRSPYPGLMHFTRFYAPVFFGREAEVRAILDRLQTGGNRFLMVSGDSGVGKSSVVDAGVLPRLEEGGLPGGRSCRCVRMVPSQGEHPFDALARALKPQAEQAGIDDYALGKQLLKKPTNLPARIGDLVAGGSALVLFLDQMEELFTSQAREHADAFLAALCETARKGLIWVITTIRSDHLHHCHRHPDLLQVLRGQGHYPLGPVDAIAMADMVQKPAHCAGLEVSDRLVRRIVKETGTDPGSLPLLAFVLQQLFLKREDRTLSEAVYDGFGGVAGAIKQHVQTVEESLRREIGCAVDGLMPRLFQSLVVVDREGMPTRRRVQLSDLSGDLGKLADELIKARLLCTEGQGLNSTVSVTHEKLFKAWPALEQWIATNKDDLWLLRQIRLAAAEWAREPLDKEKEKHLWPDERVKDVSGMIERLDLTAEDFSETERSFLGPVDRDAMLAELVDPATTHKRRATIGRRLSLLGDPRPGVGLRTDGLPDLVWCEVPGGAVTLEIERTGRLVRLLGGTKSETHPVEPFYIAKYPVTWIQYRAFLDTEDGFGNPAWWGGPQYQIVKPGRQFNRYDNHPAENLCWFEALAFCRWLSDRLGYGIGLPTEWEWQQAATGGDPANVYPWGKDWDDSRANSYDSELNRTTAVGVYPHGASPLGAIDMAGNVWEFCRNEFDRPQRVGLTGEARRVVRGGAFSDNPNFSRAAFRSDINPYDRNYNIGFRLCCASPIF